VAHERCALRPTITGFVEPTKYELAINLKTAKALGLTIPQSLPVRADQIIERFHAAQHRAPTARGSRCSPSAAERGVMRTARVER
jgi:hypothetical protein